jgi:hypothetical protein
MKPIMCWDFDETLGYFRPLEFRFLGVEAPPGMPAPRLKPDVRGLILSLQEFAHVVTTAAIRDYAREVLQEHALLDLFEAVIGREDGMLRGDGKDYGVVGERFGLAEETLSRRLLIIGNDAKHDPDFRFRQIVMIFDDQMLDQPPEPVAAAARNLLTAGEGDIKRGFDRLLDRAGGETSVASAVIHDGDVTFQLDYWGSYAEGKLHPMVIRPRPARETAPSRHG